MNDYEKQAKQFLKKVNARMKVGEPEYKSMWDESTLRYVFPVTLYRNNRSMRIHFGQSLARGSEPPTEYEVLSVIQKYDVGSFNDFCSDFGYDEDSRKAEKTYKAVCREYESVERVFGDVIDELQEIQ